jgi:hypothetical protein
VKVAVGATICCLVHIMIRMKHNVCNRSDSICIYEISRVNDKA